MGAAAMMDFRSRLGHIYLIWGRRQGARLICFVVAAPPWRCPLLFVVGRHRRAAAMGASDDEAIKMVNTRELVQYT